MSRGTLAKVISACCGLSAFAIAIVAGLSADNPGDVILLRALLAMVACQVVGAAAGAVIERVMIDSVESHKRARSGPFAGEPAAMPPAAAGGVVGGVAGVVS